MSNFDLLIGKIEILHTEFFTGMVAQHDRFLLRVDSERLVMIRLGGSTGIRTIARCKMSTSAYPQASAERAQELVSNYLRIYNSVQEVAKLNSSKPVRLIAVSKLKPSSDIMALYNSGVRHFGENYVQELVAKAHELPKDICWHFIGSLQSGKVKDLGKGIENIWAIETIDSLKKCKKLDSVRKDTGFEKINVYLQINTSNEEQKSGYSCEDLSELFETVEFLKSSECKALELKGLMTIGSFEVSTSNDEKNADFDVLVNIKKIVDEKFNTSLELSMGMSNDYQQAIKQGSTNVRIGSNIFGARPPKN